MKMPTLANRLILTVALGALVTLGGSVVPASAAETAVVVRRAPDFSWVGAKSATLRSLRGQPVVLVIAPSPTSREFRKQAKRLQEDYAELAARSAIFAAAFTDPDIGNVAIPSNVPFVNVNNGAEVAAAFGINAPFSLIVIGKDGNVDLQTVQVSPASRVRDAILNNAALQAAERAEVAAEPKQ